MIKIKKIIIKTAEMKNLGYQMNMDIAAVIIDECVSIHSIHGDAVSSPDCLEKTFYR